MNNFNTVNLKNININKNTVKIIALLSSLLIFAIGLALWENYLNNHFIGTFDQYGLPSQLFRTGWPLIIDAWPMWVIPSVLIALFVQIVDHTIRHFREIKRQKLVEENTQKTALLAEAKGKNQVEFSHVLEIEKLKQQVEILKQKYFEEHHKSQHVDQRIEEAALAMQLAQKEAAEAKALAASMSAASKSENSTAASNAHNDAIITSLKAENKKLQKQIAELQEDIEQSNALIEKLLESQSS